MKGLAVRAAGMGRIGLMRSGWGAVGGGGWLGRCSRTNGSFLNRFRRLKLAALSQSCLALPLEDFPKIKLLGRASGNRRGRNLNRANRRCRPLWTLLGNDRGRNNFRHLFLHLILFLLSVWLCSCSKFFRLFLLHLDFLRHFLYHELLFDRTRPGSDLLLKMFLLHHQFLLLQFLYDDFLYDHFLLDHFLFENDFGFFRNHSKPNGCLNGIDGPVFLFDHRLLLFGSRVQFPDDRLNRHGRHH